MKKHTRKFLLIGVLLLLMLTLSGGLTFAQDPSPQTCGTDSGEGCAPVSELVDLAEPSFSNPTNVTNPLFPISDLLAALKPTN